MTQGLSSLLARISEEQQDVPCARLQADEIVQKTSIHDVITKNSCVQELLICLILGFYHASGLSPLRIEVGLPQPTSNRVI